MVETRANVSCCGLGSCVTPQCAAVRRLTGPDDRHQRQRGRGPRAVLRPTGTGATSPGDAASTAVGGAAAGWVAAAHRGAEDRAHALRADPRRSCAANGGTAGGFLQGFGRRGARRLSKCPRSHMILSLSALWTSRIALRIAEQIVSTPVPRGRVQGFLPVQSSTAISPSGKRLSELIVEQFVCPSSAKRTSERIVEQIVDIPSGVGLGQGSSSSACPAEEDFTGVFRTFPHGKKVRSAGQVSADLPWHVSSWTPAAYGQPRGSIEKEKDELLKREEQEELNSLWAVPVERRSHQQMQRITYLLLKKTGAKKKRKKRKKKLPKTSSSGGPARRRQRQWHVSGFPGDFSPRAVSLICRQAQMLGIMAGLDQKNRYAVMRPHFSSATALVCTWLVFLVTLHLALCSCVFAWPKMLRFMAGFQSSRPLVVDSGGVFMVGFTGDDAPRAVLFFLVVRPKMLGIMAGLDQKDSCLEEYRKTGLFFYVNMWIADPEVDPRSQDMFSDPLYLTVTCSVFVFGFGEQEYGFSGR